MSALRTVGLAKQFGSARALDGVDLDVADGHVHGLLGPNGAGKTTLLRILFGLIRADAGQVQLDRDSVAGFVEQPRFYPYLSAQANLEVLALLDRDSNRDQIPNVLDRVGLTDRKDSRVAEYSTGMVMRLGIAAVLLPAPRLILLDEPTAGLDPQGIRDIGALVRELAAIGVSVLLSSHQIGEVEDVCDAVTVLRRGQVAWAGSIPELRAQAPASTYRLVTSDDDRARELIAREMRVESTVSHQGETVISADEVLLDELVLALARAGIAVRRLELLQSPLESMFFRLTTAVPTG